MDITLAVTVLLAGIVVVFIILLLLVFIVKGYGSIVYSIQNKPKKQKNDEVPAEQPTQTALSKTKEPEAFAAGVPGEVIAAISAAVYTVYDKETVKIKSIKPSRQDRPVWGTAGVMDNTRPFI